MFFPYAKSKYTDLSAKNSPDTNDNFKESSCLYYMKASFKYVDDISEAQYTEPD
jgi:hypothetical protein